jgi:indolepyruvate ferredoxin oxidoreductase beta subunit
LTAASRELPAEAETKTLGVDANSIAPFNPESARTDAPRAITLAILAMGGEGGGVLADWIVDLAEHGGYRAQTTSVPGVAQRTGATIYYLELFPEAASRAAGKDPVLSLVPVPGEVDIVIASELMEAGRAVQRGLVTPDRTTLIASTNRVYSMTEKTALGDGAVDSGKLLNICGAAAKSFIQNDFARIADENRSVISAVLFGALAKAGSLPFQRAEFEDAIRRGAVGVESSLGAFNSGYLQSANLPRAHPPLSPARQEKKIGPRLRELAARIERDFPEPSHEIVISGSERLTDYQDEKYAEEYLARLEPVRQLDAQFGDNDAALLRETARYLALWMSYEDAPRVADLKIRRTRFERVQRESRANSSQLLQINEYLHPGVEEISDMLPARLGQWLLDTPWARRLLQRVTERGRIVQTTSLHGFLQLYIISGFRRWRRDSLRFRHERQRIEAWLEQIPALAAENFALALEVAEFPRVVKGYGDTHVRGRKSFDALMGALALLRRERDAAISVHKLREAALADEDGARFAQTLREVTA